MTIAILLMAVQVKAATPVTILWTAPIDPPDNVAASLYSLRYAKTPDSLISNWAVCRQVPSMPIPSMPSLTDSVKFNVPTGDSLYFAIKAADKVPNWSVLSTIIIIYAPDNQPPTSCGNPRYFIR